MLPREVRDALDYPVPAHSLRAGYALGGMALGVFGLLFLSGVLLAYFGYIPSTEKAFESVVEISRTPALAQLRAVHSVSAELFLILLALHITRIVLTKSYYGARRVTWNIGILLLLLATVLFFTGTLLKWDQESYEAYAHVLWANEFFPYGDRVNALLFEDRAPLKMFIVHVALLPLLTFAFMGVHALLIKALKISGLNPADPPAPETERFLRHLKVVAVYSALIAAAIVAVSFFYQPDLTGEPYKGVEWTKPPWPFLFLYTLENWFGIWPLLLAPPLLLAWLLAIPSLSKKAKGWDAGQIFYFSVIVLILALILIGAWSAPMEHMM